MTSSTICSHHRIRTVLLMCVVLLSASLHAQAQNKETRINLNIRNATLESFVKQLENATGFSFIYGEEVKLTHRITLEMKQKNISEILQRAFENEPIHDDLVAFSSPPDASLRYQLLDEQNQIQLEKTIPYSTALSFIACFAFYLSSFNAFCRSTNEKILSVVNNQACKA